MQATRHAGLIAFAMGVLMAAPGIARAATLAEEGKVIFENRCATCHQKTSPSASTLGPDLKGIIGRKAGVGSTGVHSRALTESGIVWSADGLRRFLANPAAAVPGTIMPVQVTDPKDAERIVEYLQSLR